MTPRHAKTLELRRKGYRKYSERTVRGHKVLVYRRRVWERGVTHDTFIEIWPNGYITEHHSAQPGVVG